jgi:hypothetical protein
LQAIEERAAHVLSSHNPLRFSKHATDGRPAPHHIGARSYGMDAV